MTRVSLIVAAGSIVLATPASAQSDSQIVFGIYYRCSQALESRADEVVRGTLGPIAQRHVDSGALTSWNWLAHAQGGEWRRVFVTIGTDLGTQMETRAQIEQEFLERHSDEAAALTSACPSHDDYIWTGVATSGPAATNVAGPASISAYHVCDRSRETRADEIFTQVLAPLYKKHQDMGHIATWNFSAHRMGGMFRRLETFSGADHMTLLNMQDAIFNEAIQTNPLAMQELNQICSWHTDYMWESATQQ
jgi:hypothetical protein